MLLDRPTPPPPCPDGASETQVRDLRALLEERSRQLEQLQEELDETNRGVLVLYAELDNQAQQLRVASQRSESKFLTLYTQAPNGIALMDDAGVVLDANPALLKLLARPFEEVVGRRLSELARAEWAFRIDAFPTLAEDAQAACELPMTRPDGSLVYVEWNVSPQIEPAVTMAVATDVSTRVGLERQRVQWLDRERVARGEAEQTSRLKDDFIAVLSHELRTPLNAIAGWTQVLKRRGGSEEIMRGLAAIERNTHTQARMISDLLDMSRLNMGKLAMAFAMIDPADEIVGALEALRHAFDEKDIRLEIRQSPPFRQIKADASRLQQVVWNLASNAIKFSPRGGLIAASLDEGPDGFRFEIIDAGQGIAADFLPFVFDRFAQSDAAGNRHKGGLGLGLAIVKQVVEAHGGRVSVRSGGPGAGAAFEVLLPFEARAPAADAEPDTGFGAPEPAGFSDLPLEGLELLIVDDDLDARTMLQIILGDRGAAVRAAAGVREALDHLDAAWPDALVSDIGMPEQDGYDLIREIRRREAAPGAPGRRRLAAIALTSFNRPQDREQALAAGFDAHCAKPLRPLNLVQRIMQALEAASAPPAGA